MVAAFAALAGIYALMGATLVAAAQVLVYLGAISVLILFAIMLTQSKSGPARLVFHHQAWAAAIAAIGIGVLLIISVILHDLAERGARAHRAERSGRRDVLFEDYVLAFEVISVLLLAAVDRGHLPRASRRDAGAGRVAPERGRRHRARPAGRTRAGGGAVSQSLDAYLILACAHVRHRHVRVPGHAATPSRCS